VPWLVANSIRSCFETREVYNGEDVSPAKPFGREGSYPPDWLTYLQDSVASVDVARASTMTPLTIRLTTKRDTLLDNIETYEMGDFTISDRVRRTIEAHEPGRHYFFRCNILNFDWSPWPEQYWVFKAGPSAIVQALIVEQSERAEWENYPHTSSENYHSCLVVDVGRVWKTMTSLLRQVADFPGGLTLDEASFVGRHVVKEKVFREQKSLFLSNAVVADLKRAKVTGFKFCKAKAAPRMVPPYGVSNGNGAVALPDRVERITPPALGPECRRMW
jgi:hypothetical protein